MTTAAQAETEGTVLYCNEQLPTKDFLQLLERRRSHYLVRLTI